MSVFAVNHLCRELLRDHKFRAAMKADPAAALAGLDLTKAERDALLAGDVAALYRMGVNSFLMGYLCRFEVCGLTLDVYNSRIRSAAHVGDIEHTAVVPAQAGTHREAGHVARWAAAKQRPMAQRNVWSAHGSPLARGRQRCGRPLNTSTPARAWRCWPW